MKMYFFSLTTIIIGLSLLGVSAPAHAQNSCSDVYGGGQTCVQHKDVQINKLVKEQDSSEYRDNLTAESNYFRPGQTVNFRVTVKNTSSGILEKITVTDKIPGFIEFVNGDGTYARETRTVTTEIARLSIGEVKTININTRIAAANVLPSSPSPLCMSNQATATASNNRVSTDNATFCIETRTLAAQTQTVTPGRTTTGTTNQSRNGLPVYGSVTTTQTPATGAETIALASLLIPGISGWYLRKKTFTK